jgi:hypothetical protein
MLADPKLKAVVLKLTGSDYELFLRGSYEGVARELLDNLAMKPNMVLVYESLLTGSTVDDSEPEYKPEDVVVQQELDAVDSVVTMSNPMISRRPSPLTAVATTAETFTTRPPSRTFWVRASIHT